MKDSNWTLSKKCQPILPIPSFASLFRPTTRGSKCFFDPVHLLFKSNVQNLFLIERFGFIFNHDLRSIYQVSNSVAK